MDLTPSSLVVTTFGLLSPGKGIEHAIAAAGALRHVHDEVVYVVAGRTHPHVVRHEGERYREQLHAQVRDSGWKTSWCSVIGSTPSTSLLRSWPRPMSS